MLGMGLSAVLVGGGYALGSQNDSPSAGITESTAVVIDSETGSESRRDSPT